MNILVRFLRDHPDALRELADQGTDTVSLEAIVDLVARRGEFPVTLDRDLLEELSKEPLGEALIGGYVPVIEQTWWRGQVAAARPDDSDSSSAEWVTFIESPGDERGVSLPDERAGPLRASVFTRVNDSVRRVSIDYAAPQMRPAGLSISLPHGCSLPDWGECASGECHGDCELRRRHDDSDGLVCRCPHS